MRSFVAVCLILGLATARTGSAQTTPARTPPKKSSSVKATKDAKPVRVLFLGNSYTFANELPLMVAAIGEAANPKQPIEARMLAPAGWTLRQHWEQEGDDAPRTVLKQGRWDFVVLQEQSQLPYMKPDELLDYAARFAAEITAVKAKPVFFMTWARVNEDFRQAQITEAYGKAATASKALLAPVGSAWERALADTKGLELHENDGSHPNQSGSWLAAAVLYATMFGGDIHAVPARLRTMDHDAPRTLVDLKPTDAARLQAAAAAVMAPPPGTALPPQPPSKPKGDR